MTAPAWREGRESNEALLWREVSAVAHPFSFLLLQQRNSFSWFSPLNNQLNVMNIIPVTLSVLLGLFLFQMSAHFALGENNTDRLSLKIGFLISWTGAYPLGERTGSAGPLAVDEVKRRNLLPGYNIEWTWRDTSWNSRKGLVGAVDMWSQYGGDIDAFIGLTSHFIHTNKSYFFKIKLIKVACRKNLAHKGPDQMYPWLHVSGLNCLDITTHQLRRFCSIFEPLWATWIKHTFHSFWFDKAPSSTFFFWCIIWSGQESVTNWWPLIFWQLKFASWGSVPLGQLVILGSSSRTSWELYLNGRLISMCSLTFWAFVFLSNVLYSPHQSSSSLLGPRSRNGTGRHKCAHVCACTSERSCELRKWRMSQKSFSASLSCPSLWKDTHAPQFKVSVVALVSPHLSALDSAGQAKGEPDRNFGTDISASFAGT